MGLRADFPDRANYGGAGIGATSAVGCFPTGASPYRCEDLSGNVWEWSRSLWGKDWQEAKFAYPYDPKDGREDVAAGQEVHRVLRGGAFISSEEYVRCAFRNWSVPRYRSHSVGFRVVVSRF